MGGRRGKALSAAGRRPRLAATAAAGKPDAERPARSCRSRSCRSRSRSPGRTRVRHRPPGRRGDPALLPDRPRHRPQGRPLTGHRGRPCRRRRDRAGAGGADPGHPGGLGGARRQPPDGRRGRLLAGRSARRHAGIHQPARRIHRQHRPGRRQAAGVRRARHPGTKRRLCRLHGRERDGRREPGRPAMGRRSPSPSGRSRRPASSSPPSRSHDNWDELDDFLDGENVAPPDHRRQRAQIRPGRRRQRRPLSAPRPDHGMGHRGRPGRSSRPPAAPCGCWTAGC